MDQRFRGTMALSRAARDFQLSPSRSAKDAAGFLSGMASATAEAIGDPAITVKRDIAYASHPDARLDVFLPAAASDSLPPALVFIHGGFWQEGDKSVSGFAARTFLSQGWAWVSVGYTLAPAFTLTRICAQVSEACAYIRTHAADLGVDPERIVIAGHSAGGHLAAAMLAGLTERDAAASMAGAVLISGVFELAPIAASYVNDLVRMTEAEVAQLSPLRALPKGDVPVHVLIGADEPEAFHVQSDALCDLWAEHLTRLTRDTAAGRDHFDVLDALNDVASPTWAALREMVQEPVFPPDKND